MSELRKAAQAVVDWAADGTDVFYNSDLIANLAEALASTPPAEPAPEEGFHDCYVEPAAQPVEYDDLCYALENASVRRSLMVEAAAEIRRLRMGLTSNAHIALAVAKTERDQLAATLAQREREIADMMKAQELRAATIRRLQAVIDGIRNPRDCGFVSEMHYWDTHIAPAQSAADRGEAK